MLLENLNKKTKIKEISIQLLNTCSNKCSFCIIHNIDLCYYSIDNLNNILLTVFKIFETDVSTKEFDIILQGGEIFEDNITDKQINEYKQFIKKIYDKSIVLNKKINIKLTTNLLYTNISRIENLINEFKNILNITIGTSFDFVGRFHNENSLNLFIKNIYKLRQYIDPISITLTKQNILAILKPNLNNIYNSFIQLYNDDFRFSFEIYFPDKHTYKISMPSNELLLDFYKYLIDNFNNLQPIKNLLNKNSMTHCACNYLILPNGKLTSCKEWIFDKNLWNSPDGSLDEHIKNFLNYYNCLACKYFKRCEMSCFYVFDCKLLNRTNNCIYKEIYEYIDKK